MKNIKFRYAYKRKSDGHIYQIIYSLESIENGSEGFSDMLNNDLWEIMGRDRYTELWDKNNNEIFENDGIEYTQHHFNTPMIKTKRKIVKWSYDKWNVYETNAGESDVKIIGNVYNDLELLEV